MNPDPLQDLATLTRYAALGIAHTPDPIGDSVVVASAALRLRQALAPKPPEPSAEPPAEVPPMEG